MENKVESFSNQEESYLETSSMYSPLVFFCFPFLFQINLGPGITNQFPLFAKLNNLNDIKMWIW
jgi:hypothetical protein